MTILTASAATFRRDWSYKLAFVALVYFDLALTLLALSLGFRELNPVFARMLGEPVLLLAVKLLLPLSIVYLVPGKLLLPSFAVLGLVTAWNLSTLALV
ncbi:MAG: hypothetical protein FJ318_08455 [SAR202 cluster bacterium]|nr:hypothetical protein [SAR202 cluster bacterium]